MLEYSNGSSSSDETQKEYNDFIKSCLKNKKMEKEVAYYF